MTERDSSVLDLLLRSPRAAHIVDTPLRRWRRAAGLTQAQMAERCGLKLSTYRKYENGLRVPQGIRLQALMRVTNLSSDPLILPNQYLDNDPSYLADYAEIPKRGRPTKESPTL